LADANRGTMRAEYPAVERRTVFVEAKRRSRVGWKARLTGLHALYRTSLVITGRQPSMWDAKAYFATGETRNFKLRFAESHDRSRGRRSRL